MTSKYEEIQNIYNIIKEYKTVYEDEDNDVNKNLLSTKEELISLIDKLIGINTDFIEKPFKWEEPFKISKGPLWSDNTYHIVFFEYGIRICMTVSMLKKISILDRILIKNNGSDKPIRLNYYSKKHNKIFKGPNLFITNLDPHSLLYNKPPDDYNIETRSGNNIHENYFKQKSLAESLYYTIWY